MWQFFCIFAKKIDAMGTDKLDKTRKAKGEMDKGEINKEAKTPARKRGPKKFKLHRMTKKQLEEERIPAYDYLIP